MTTIRDYDRERDRNAALRILREVGWIEEGKEKQADLSIDAGRAMIAEVDGSPECLVTTAPGALRYLDRDLSFSAVTGVTTSRVARKRGLAARVTSALIAQDAADGVAVCGLGMFEQGYYDRLGFGSGPYEHTIRCDPARLKVEPSGRAPRRLGVEDWEEVHASRLRRSRSHGSLSLTPAALTHSDMLWTKNGFGLGYSDAPDGTLTHLIWCGTQNVERGPYRVHCMAFQTDAQFLELLGAIKALGDQVRLVSLQEPPGIQMQDLVEEPFKQRQISEKSSFAAGIRASAWWQMRICDLAECLSHTHLATGEVSFNLSLSDPIEAYQPKGSSWAGVSGDYVVHLGRDSSAEPGQSASLPTLTASVNAFTRLWLGVRPASGLSVTDDLSGPDDLLATLDRVLLLPQPHVEWDY